MESKMNLFTVLENHHLMERVTERSRKKAMSLNVKRFLHQTTHTYLVEILSTYRITIEENYQKVEVLKNDAWILLKGSRPVSLRIIIEALTNERKGIKTT